MVKVPTAANTCQPLCRIFVQPLVHGEIGVRLRAARLARGWALDDVAVGLHQLSAELGEPEPGADFALVWKWENGARTPGRYYQARLCILFDMMPGELGFVESPRLNRDIGELKGRRSARLEPVTGANPGEHLSASAFPNVDREHLRLAVRHLWPVDRSLLAGLQRAGKELIRRSDIEPPMLIVPDMHNFRAALMTLLARSQAQDTASQLQTLASEMSRSIAWLNDHTLRWPDTYTNYAVAESLAREAGSGNQLAQVLVNRSEVYLGRATKPEDMEAAAQLAEAASTMIGPDALGGLKAWVLAVRAVFAATEGHEAAALRYLDHAYHIAMMAPDELNLFSDFDSAWLDSYRATVIMRLRPLEAIDMFADVLKRTAPELTWERVSALNRLAESYATVPTPDVEQISALLRQSVELAQRTGDVRGLTLAVQLRERRLARWRTEPAVRRLDDAIRAARR
jgi:transcriptional regulator with XRE-family HTH domain